MERGVLGAYRTQEQPAVDRRAPRGSAAARPNAPVVPEYGTGQPAPARPGARSTPGRLSGLALAAASLVALAAFCWPLVAAAVPAQAYAAVRRRRSARTLYRDIEPQECATTTPGVTDTAAECRSVTA